MSRTTPESSFACRRGARLAGGGDQHPQCASVLRGDNGPEFIAKEVQRWLAENDIKTIYIDPGSPWQNGFVESFHGRWRDECLNQEQLWTLTKARVVIEAFHCEYNERWPYGKLSYQCPARFAAQLSPLTPAPFQEAGQTESTFIMGAIS